MSGFEFYFSFFGLILGIAVANVGVGFGRLWRARQHAKVGLCIPLLGVWLLLHAIMNWLTAWQSLQHVPVDMTSLLVGVFVALPYVLVSTVMFPEDAEAQGSLDEFYLRHSRLVMLAMMTPTLSGMVGYIVVFGRPFTAAWALDTFLNLLALPLVLAFWRNLWAHRIGLGAIVALLLWYLYH